jgi:hypothetical protein
MRNDVALVKELTLPLLLVSGYSAVTYSLEFDSRSTATDHFMSFSWEEHHSALVCRLIVLSEILADSLKTSTHGPARLAWMLSRRI